MSHKMLGHTLSICYTIFKVYLTILGHYANVRDLNWQIPTNYGDNLSSRGFDMDL